MNTPPDSGRPELRISDIEREAAVTALGEHYAAGRLTKDEYDERTATAFAARTASALRPLFADLPAPHPSAGPGAWDDVAAAGARSGRGRSGPSSAPRPGWGLPPAIGGPGVRRSAPRLPVLPLVLVLLGLAILLGAPWLLFVGLGALCFARAHRRGDHAGWHGCGSGRAHPGHSSGSDRPERGRWA